MRNASYIIAIPMSLNKTNYENIQEQTRNGVLSAVLMLEFMTKNFERNRM